MKQNDKLADVCFRFTKKKKKKYFKLEDTYKTMNFDDKFNAHLVAER